MCPDDWLGLVDSVFETFWEDSGEDGSGCPSLKSCWPHGNDLQRQARWVTLSGVGAQTGGRRGDRGPHGVDGLVGHLGECVSNGIEWTQSLAGPVGARGGPRSIIISEGRDGVPSLARRPARAVRPPRSGTTSRESAAGGGPRSSPRLPARFINSVLKESPMLRKEGN